METKLIFKQYIARKLLNNGNRIVDIKPDKLKQNSTIFVFEKTDKLLSDLYELTK